MAAKPVQYEIVAPRPAAISESLRAFGYTFESAVADLVDNCITGGAGTVRIGFDWNKGNPFLWIADDGRGMAAEQLTEAMRAGSQSPLDERHPDDLGRFGLGLKTASFSQCRRLTVASRPVGGELAVRCWDLDVIRKTDEWRLLEEPSPLVAPTAKAFKEKHGTLVIWENLDRWTTAGEEQATYKHFTEKIEQVQRHLEMVFHRFLGPKLVIEIAGVAIEAWDPFLEGHKATQELRDEALRIFGRRLSVHPYVLPHKSFLKPQEHRKAAGPKGWNAQQGFYLYRNERLIIAGDWLGLGFQQEEHFKLARIRVDLPNTMDAEWQLDVKKSTAVPPPGLRKDLERIAKFTRGEASKVYRHRGKEVRRKSQQDTDLVWKQVKGRDSVMFRVNRKHTVLAALLKEAGPAGTQIIDLLEGTIPVESIVMANAESPDTLRTDENYETSPMLEKRALALLRLKIEEGGLDPRQAFEEVARIEPFDRSPRLLAKAEAFLEKLE